jgi:hypothetical protein
MIHVGTYNMEPKYRNSCSNSLTALFFFANVGHGERVEEDTFMQPPLEKGAEGEVLRNGEEGGPSCEVYKK